MTRVLKLDGAVPDASGLAEAVAALVRHELLVYPTETLYALGGVPTRDVATRIRDAKQREQGKPLPLVAADIKQSRALCREWPEVAQALAERFWPGPLTLVLAAHWGLPQEVTAGSGRIAVRVPGLPLARALCAATGPLISTSANLSGQSPHATCAPAVAEVGARASLAIDAGTLGGVASTVLDVTQAPRVLRAGAVTLGQLVEALREAGVSLQTDPEETTPP